MFATLMFVGILLEPGPPPPVHIAAGALRPRLSLTAISNANVSPSTITFAANDPSGSPVVAGSSSAVVAWQTAGGSLGAWTLKVSAPSSFASCPQLPASAITVSCSSLSGGLLTLMGNCAGSSVLSTTPTLVASGIEPSATSATYAITLSFTLLDSWKYISSSCSLSVSYLISAL